LIIRLNLRLSCLWRCNFHIIWQLRWRRWWLSLISQIS
jgi:hypothetical protein